MTTKRFKKRSQTTKTNANRLKPHSKELLRLDRHPQATKPTASSKPERISNALTLAKHSHQNRSKKGKRQQMRCQKKRGLDKINRIKNMSKANSKVQSSNLAFRKEFIIKKRKRKGHMEQELSSWQAEAAAR